MTDSTTSDASDGEAAGSDAVEQLQRALLTLIGASRVALDALEAVVADRSRLDHLAASGRDLAGTVLSLAGCTGAGDAAEPSAAGEGSPS